MKTDSTQIRRQRFRASRTLINITVSAVLLAVLVWLVDLRSLGTLQLSADLLLGAVTAVAALADRAMMIEK